MENVRKVCAVLYGLYGLASTRGAGFRKRLKPVKSLASGWAATSHSYEKMLAPGLFSFAGIGL
jgi:hypothetical protein